MSFQAPGRPRRTETGDTILDAVMSIIRTDGYGELGFERVARLSGVAKATIYRRFATRGELAMEAMLREAERRWPANAAPVAPDAYVAAVFAAATDLAPALKGLMADAQLDPRFKEPFRTRFVTQRREALAAVLRADARSRDLDSRDIAFGLDLIFGTMWYRLLVGHGVLDRALAERLCDLVFRSAATPEITNVSAAAGQQPKRKAGLRPASRRRSASRITPS